MVAVMYTIVWLMYNVSCPSEHATIACTGVQNRGHKDSVLNIESQFVVIQLPMGSLSSSLPFSLSRSLPLSLPLSPPVSYTV